MQASDEPISATIRMVAEVDDDQYEWLLDFIRAPEGFSRNAQRCYKLGQALGYNAPTAFQYLGALERIYKRFAEWVKEGKDAEEELKNFLKSTGLWDELGNEPEKNFARLSRLLERNPSYDEREKLEWLRTGILDQAMEFSSFVDLRPDFSDDRSQVRSLVPVVILQIMAVPDAGSAKPLVVQLSQHGVRELEKVVRDIRRKLSTLKEDTRLSSLPIKFEDGEEMADE